MPRLSRREFVARFGGTLLGLSAAGPLVWAQQPPLPPPPPPTRSFPKDRILQLEELAPALMRQTEVPGLAMAWAWDEEILWSRAVGIEDAVSRTPVTAKTVFEAASLSKPVFAYGVLKLVEQGRLELDAPLRDYLADPFRPRSTLMASRIPADPRLDRVTPRHVLSHATGFPNWSRGDLLQFRFPPGEQFGYSGEAYVYLQNVVEHVTGQPLAEYLHRAVLKPLEMKNSSYVWREEFDERAAIGHARNGRPQPKQKPLRANAASSLHTTAEDFGRFLLAMLEPDPDEDSRLSRRGLKEMLKPQVMVNDSLSWGLGWGLEHTEERDYFWHWGDNEFFQCFTMGSRAEKSALIILTNSANGLQACRPLVQLALGGKHPAFSFDLLDY